MPNALHAVSGRRVLTGIVLPTLGLVVLMYGLGWLVTRGLAHVWPLTAEDGVDRFLAAHRDRPLNDLSGFLSTVADTPCASALAAAAVLCARWFYGRWREALFIAAAMLIEVGVFLLTTVLIHRRRPGVVELDHSPPTSSFPSGHTAAALALYGAVALLVYLYTHKRFAWLLLLMPAAVGAARLYRGMHHPSDVVAGLVLGLCAILIARHALLAPEAAAAPRRVRALKRARPALVEGGRR